MENVHQRLLAMETIWRAQPNHESLQPPLYYALAGLWWRIGKECGLHDGFLLYWIRFLNVFIIAALVWFVLMNEFPVMFANTPPVEVGESMM